MARQFTAHFHWELSRPITTNHLLSVISLTNTFMIMANASFSSSKFEYNRRLIRKLSRQNSSSPGSGNTPVKESTIVENENDAKIRQQQIHDAWQLIGALHCVLMPDLIKSPFLKRPLVDLLARRWQDRCIEIRQAAQDLLLSELKSIGSKGRRLIVEKWSLYLPSRRRQATAIVLMGVIGSVYGSEIESNKTTINTTNRLDPNDLQPPQPVRRRSVIDGFGGGGNYNLARKTSKALSYLLLAPPSNSLPYHTSLRRASIDLIGRGFVVWEPYLDVSKILLALLEFCCSTDTEQSMVPSLKFGLPLTPAADSARTARYALQMIAEARP
ncbi:hypothetical protein BLA29_005758, partial [Euroglyphus maynei]